MNRIAPYAKAIIAVAGAVLTAVMTQFPDNAAVQQWGPIVSALLTALAVYVVPNQPAAPDYEARTLGKAFTGGTFSQAEEDRRNR